MRNELAGEYKLPDVDGAEVRLFFLENGIANAWGVAIRSTDTAATVYSKGATPRRAFAAAYEEYASLEQNVED